MPRAECRKELGRREAAMLEARRRLRPARAIEGAPPDGMVRGPRQGARRTGVGGLPGQVGSPPPLIAPCRRAHSNRQLYNGVMTPESVADVALPAVPLTVEGASVLHQMMRFRWPAWRALCSAETRPRFSTKPPQTFSAMAQLPPTAARAASTRCSGTKATCCLSISAAASRSSTRRRTRTGAPAPQRLPGAHHLLSLDHRAGALRFHLQGLRRPGRQGRPAAFGGMEARDRSRAGSPAAGHGAPAVARNPRCQIHLLLPHGPAPRRVRQLVHASPWPTASA